MRRINEQTGKYFVRGDINANGKVFCSYKVGKPLKTGYYYEWWQSKEKFYAQNKKMANYSFEKSQTIDGRAKKLLNGAITRTKKNNSQISITWEWIAKKIQDGKCELTGLPFDLTPPKNGKNNPYSPSLDRIDSNNKDYTESNVRVVLCAVNMALNEFGLETMKPILEKLIK